MGKVLETSLFSVCLICFCKNIDIFVKSWGSLELSLEMKQTWKLLEITQVIHSFELVQLSFNDVESIQNMN